MKKRFHVFSRMFTKVNVFLFLLFALLMVPSAWADNVSVTANGQTVYTSCSSDRIVTVASGVTSFVIESPKGSVPYRCEGVLYVNAPNEKTLSLSGETKLRQHNSLYIYDLSGASSSTLDLYTNSGSYTISSVYSKGPNISIKFSNDGQMDYENYVKLNVSVHAFYYASVSIPWEKDEPWLYYQIWEKATSFYFDPWEETESGYYESNPVKFYVGRNIYLKNNRGNMSIWGINVKDANGNLLPVRVLETGEYATGALYPSTSYLDRCLWFKMPESDVVVVPTYASYPSYSFDEIPRGFGYNLVNESRAVRVDSSIHVFDDGGIDYKYANNFDGYLTVTAHKGHRVKVTGTVATEEGGYDYLEVFEGKKGESTTPICKVYSASRNVAVAVPDKCKSADSVLTLHFKTDPSIFADGLDLVVSAEAVTYKVELNNNQTSYGTISTDKTSSPPGYTVTLTAHPKSGYVLKSVSVINTATNETVTTSGGRETDNKITFTMPAGNVRVTPTFVKDTYSITKTTGAGGSLDVASSAKVGTTVTMEAKPQSGYMVRNIEVVAKNGDAVKVDGGWYNDEKASFIMPLSDVTVKSTYTNNLTAGDGGLYINMPTTGTVNATIPKEVKSFKVYDDGGKDGNYSSGGILTLTAPEGYVLQVTGSIDLAKHNCWMEYCYDSLYVYDGVGIDSKKLYSGRETVNDIGRNMSSGRSMTIQFKGYARDGIASGLDLTVSLHKLDMELEKDNNGNYYVDMLVRNATTLKIPKGITSFKVYDDGGKDGDYSDNFSGILTLTAPEGCVLQLTGSINLAKTPGMYTYYYDYLYVYDGADIDSDILYSAKETVNDIGKKMSSGRSLTIRFSGISDDVASGLDLTVKVISVENQITYKNMNSGGTIASSSPTTGEMYKTVEYTYNFNSGYLVRDIEVIAENGDAVKASGGWYTQKTATFKMPPCNVTVKSTYTNNLTAAGGLYIDMPTTGTVNATIPEGVKSFKVYDDGGKDGSYSSGSGGILTLTAPEGYVLQVTGSIDLGKYAGFLAFDYLYDSLYVYDGADINSDRLYSGRETVDDIGKRMSSGRSITIWLKRYSDGASGIDLTVTLHKLDMELQKDNNGNFYVNMLLKNAATLKIPKGVTSFKVYDEGGKDGDYSTYFDGSLTLTAPEGYVLQVTGSIELARFTGLTGYAYDLLNVYDGADINSVRLYSGRETVNDIGLHTSSGHNMTIRFEKHGSPSFAPGFDLTVTLIPVEYTVTVGNVAGGRLADGVPATANMGDEITLTAVPANGNMLIKFVVKDAAGNELPVIRNTLTEGKFKMPASNVTVSLVFAGPNANVTAEKGLHFDMTRNSKVAINLPAAVKSFNLYDHGGKTGDYIENSNDTLVFRAPAGYHFELTGSIYTERNYDFLYVYDGASTTEKVLFNRSSAEYGTRYDVGTIETSSNTMTVRFRSDGNRNYAGLDLLVTVVPSSYTVAIEQTSGGTLSSDKASAIMGEKVTLTATPDDGYMLNGFVIKDASGNDVPFRGGDFIDKKGSFTMPAGNVTVTPVFTDKPVNLFVTIPVTGTKTVVLPDGMNSFKVYDDGGSTGLLTQGYNANGTLVLIAPDNAKINATVVAGVASPATLKTYDGESTDATLLGSAQIGFREKYTSTGNAMTFNMTTGENVSGTADISINVLATRNINVVSVDGGSAASDKATADRNETITVTATPDDGLLFKGIKITNKFGDVLGMKGYETWVNDIWTADDIANLTQTVSFRMPNSDINVEPMFGEELEASDSLFLKMPETGSETVTIPSRVASFNVYDDGGRGGTFSSNADGNLVLTAPEGFRFQVSGSVSAWAKDIAHLCVYEGGTVSDDKALACGAGSVFTAGTGQDYDSYVGEIGTTVSEGNTITLRFWTTSSWTTGDGIELVVTLVSDIHKIKVAKASGGKLSSDKQKALQGETVTLTATPAEGYLFDGVSVEDADGNVVALSKDIHWYSGVSENVVTFSMPTNAVTVTPKFSSIDDLYVNMPKSGEFDVNIPQNVTSFKIYDDGGENGDYSNGGIGQVSVIYDKNSGNAGLKLSGSVSVKNGTTLNIYAMNDDIDIFYTNNGSSDGHAEDIGTFINSSSLLFEFSKGASSAAGLDLRVDVVKSPGGGVEVVYDDAHVIGNGNISRWVTIADGDKTSKVNIPEDVDVESVDMTRTFTPDVYSTMVLPFSVSTEKVEGLKAALRYNGIKTVNGVSSIRMKVVWAAECVIKDDKGNCVSYKDTVLNANTPYMVQMGQGKLVVNGGVTLKKTAPADTSIDGWIFRGTWQYKKWGASGVDPETGYAYGFAASESGSGDNKISVGEFVRAGEGAWISPMRAYLVRADKAPVQGVRANGNYVMRPSFAQEELPELLNVVIDHGDGDEEHTTVIGHFNTRTGEFKMNNDAIKRTFDVKGRNVGDKASKARGAYYGKKVIAK